MTTHSPYRLLKARYRILNTIGEGGMGKVYKAVDTHLEDRLVAIKEMTQQPVNQQEHIETVNAFQREAVLLASLQHPHLPNVYDHFFETSNWYLVMSFIEGETLEQYLSTSPLQRLSVNEVLKIGLQLCSVLEYLHGQKTPIVFRDLKPANIMRTPQGHLYLIDFGIARLFKPGQAKDTAAFGSAGYAAPEQYGKAQSSPRSDIYSLGATLHQLLTGDDPSLAPFRFAPLHALNIPYELDVLLQQMLAMEPAQRPANVAELSWRLQSLATGQSGATPRVLQQTSPITIENPVVRPLRPPAPIGTILSVFVGHADQVTSIVWSPDGKRIASSSRDGTVRIWDVVTGSIVLIYRQHVTDVTCLAWSPTGTSIASGGGDRIIHVWNAVTGDTQSQYHGHNGLWDGGSTIKALAWSPDSKHIASVSGDHTAQIWNVTSGQKILTYCEHGNEFPVDLVAWSPDGKHIASVADYCHVWNARTGRTLYINHSYHPTAIAWSANSKFIASAYPSQLGEQSATIKLWEMHTGRQYPIYGGQREPVNMLAWSPDGHYVAAAHKDVYIWDVIAREVVYTYHGHTSQVSSLAWSPESMRIASSSIDATVQVWMASA